MAVVLGGAGEVGVQAAAGGAHVDGGAVEQPGGAEPAERGVSVPGGAVLVDVQDVWAGAPVAMARFQSGWRPNQPVTCSSSVVASR